MEKWGWMGDWIVRELVGAVLEKITTTVVQKMKWKNWNGHPHQHNKEGNMGDTGRASHRPEG